ncbi:glycosyltransferase family 2 protein [Frigidibacter sp. ROC022]|uniref:glycosyltransferase family 2 protein n=1 Tax=Frigidibacter sp. ROC022 TaxID=2971796 RepID=UPI00215B35A0|nr:glycosyltransferase family 2 protein [Frigidibacter sp. ROC022]MCR8724414.1 glycosyltransferase family 2 protein [Frigidibacter sp. ROC022]
MTSETPPAAASAAADGLSDAVPIPPAEPDLWQRLRSAYRLRWKRRRLLWRALRKRRQLRPVADRTGDIRPDTILAMATLRNEMLRLPHFLDHYRRLGVGHFLFIDNASTDGTGDYLAAQPDVSLWHTDASYRLSRFGVDWLTWLAMRHAHGHWLLTLDADEILIYPHWQTRPLAALTEWLDDRGIRSFGAMMLDMYPRGRLDAQPYRPGDDPFETLNWFDSGNYMIRRQEPMGNLWIQGGARARVFFAAQPRRAPTLNKVPLVRWNRRYAYVNSTHALLPKALNRVYDQGGGEALSGLLLHSKFLNVVVEKSREEKARKQHFNNSALYDAYYDRLIENPDLWCATSTRYRGWRHLEAVGLMSRGLWS